MIINFNKEKREYILTDSEKQEIEKIYELGGRYFYRGNTDKYLNIYDKDEYGKPNKIIAELRGNIVNVLWELGKRTEDNFIEIFSIMQMYPNLRQVNISQYLKDKFWYIYERLDGRYIRKTNGEQVMIYNDKKQFICTGDTGYIKWYELDFMDGNEIVEEDGYISIEKIINKFCK